MAKKKKTSYYFASKQRYASQFTLYFFIITLLKVLTILISLVEKTCEIKNISEQIC